jgi:hypothetical protein
MSPLSDLTAAQMRILLRERALVVGPGELLVVQVPPDWPPMKLRDLQDALRVYAECELGIPVMVVPGTAVTVARMPDDPFSES